MSTATIVHINGVGREAVELIDSVKPPMAVWQAFHSPHFDAYQIIAFGITSAGICSGVDGNEVGRVTFAATGEPVSSEQLERLNNNHYEGGVPVGWQGCEYRVVIDLLRALAQWRPIGGCDMNGVGDG